VPWVEKDASDGSEQYPHNGVSAATNGNPRTEPSIAYDAIPRHAMLVYHELTFRGEWVCGQRFAPTGLRLWGSDGGAISPIGSSPLSLYFSPEITYSSLRVRA